MSPEPHPGTADHVATGPPAPAAPSQFAAAAARGDPEAQFQLGLCHVHGWNTAVDPAAAVQWLRRAAEQGHAGAADSLGVRYATGQGVPLDETVAVQWFRRAARQGHRVALYNLGLACYFGTGTAADPVEACVSFWRAAAAGDEAATAARDRVWSELTAAQQEAARRLLSAPALLKQELGVICIGSSTGGTEALREILPALPATMPPICIVQHIQEGYSARLAASLDQRCALAIRHAAHGEPLLPGAVYVAPAGSHLVLAETAAALQVRLHTGAPCHHQRPSVDVLFHSTAQLQPARALGLVLTGMGRDGAAGLLAMRRAGAFTCTQDEATSAVYGMPRAARENGGADLAVALERIPALLQAWASGQRPPRPAPASGPALPP